MGARGLAIDGTNVYFSDSTSIYEVPIAGGTTRTLASGQHGPEAIAVDSADVYWTTLGTVANNDSDGMVLKLALDGGTPSTLATLQNAPSSIVVAGANVYWSNPGNSSGVVTVPIAGGSPMTIVAGDYPGELAVDSTYLYWSDPTGFLRLPLGGGTVATLATSIGGAFAVDSTSVYWLNVGPSVPTVRTMPLAGGAPTTLAAEFLGNYPQSIAVDSTSLYWTDTGACPTDGGACVGVVRKLTPK